MTEGDSMTKRYVGVVTAALVLVPALVALAQTQAPVRENSKIAHIDERHVSPVVQ